MFRPLKKDFLQKAVPGAVIPLSAEVLADMETPVSAFKKAVTGAYSYLLESAESGVNVGRFSIIGFDPELVFAARGRHVRLTVSGRTVVSETDDPLRFLGEILGRYTPRDPVGLELPFWGGAVGYTGYDYVRFIEKIPERPKPSLEVPDLFYTVMRNILVFDNLKRRITVIRNVFVGEDPEKDYQEACEGLEEVLKRLGSGRDEGRLFFLPPEADRSLVSEFPEEGYLAGVERIKEYIRKGDIFQCVLSQRFHTVCDVDDLNVYRSLRMINPSPYMFYLKFDDLTVFGSSPEVMVQKNGDSVMVRPIAGTRPRGANASEDRDLEIEMQEDPKERAEHLMLVDLGRNDLGRISRPGTVTVEDLMHVEKYSHVQHMVTTVRGQARPDLTIRDLVAATFPAGTVSGAPKVRAMEIIEEIEPVRRDVYAGLVGYMSFSGQFDSCIAIRTIVRKDDRLVIQAGAGIVADSIPKNEFKETMNKAGALLKAIETARGGLS
jgi:anthranilate synthase component 1